LVEVPVRVPGVELDPPTFWGWRSFFVVGFFFVVAGFYFFFVVVFSFFVIFVVFAEEVRVLYDLILARCVEASTTYQISKVIMLPSHCSLTVGVTARPACARARSAPRCCVTPESNTGLHAAALFSHRTGRFVLGFFLGALIGGAVEHLFAGE
jgi:hypothetical protein